MKAQRRERLIDMTNYLELHPDELVPLKHFAKRYGAAKSSISEDVTIVKQAFAHYHIGLVKTLPGASGGVIFTPGIDRATAKSYLEDLSAVLNDPDRILPGGYLYLSDIIGNPQLLHKIGLLIATEYADQSVDVIMTIATKGIPIAQSLSSYLGVPYVIVRRDSQVTEGPTLSVNYESGSSNRVEKMELSKRSLQRGARVVVVDDFMKGGGTVNGMRNLIDEFDCHLIGATVLAEAGENRSAKNDWATSLLDVQKINSQAHKLQIGLGNYLDRTDFKLFEP